MSELLQEYFPSPSQARGQVFTATYFRNIDPNNEKYLQGILADPDISQQDKDNLAELVESDDFVEEADKVVDESLDDSGEDV